MRRRHGLLARFDSLTGQRLLHYQVFEKIGRGVGTVYLARDTRLKRSVVVKILPPLLAEDWQARERFKREGECLSALNHPNIVAIYGLEHDRDLSFIVMEYVPGLTLRQTIQNQHLGLRQALDYGIQITDALVAAHAVGIIHRDLKPSNILVRNDGTIKVVDFGLAKWQAHWAANASEALTETGAVLGTVGYMSPEQAREQPADARSDVFSIGAILYEMINGAAAFTRSSSVETMAAVLNVQPPALPKNVPASLAAIVVRCLAKDPDHRYQTSAELRVALGNARTEIELADAQKLRKYGWPNRKALAGWAAIAVAAVVITVRPWMRVHAETLAARFERGIVLQKQANATGCFSDSTARCDLNKAISDLKASASEFDAILAARPHHASSLWNGGLAYEALCDALNRGNETSQALAACDAAISRFSQAIIPGPTYGDLPKRPPDEADVIWNRGLTHLFRAQPGGTSGQSRLADLNAAIADFDHVLSGGSKYDSFLKARHADVVAQKRAAEQERARLATAVRP